MAKDKQISPLEILKGLSLADIDAQISELQGQITGIEGQIAGLRVLRRAADCEQNGKPERKPRQKRQAAPKLAPATNGEVVIGRGRPSAMQRIVALLKQTGKSKGASIAEDLGLASDTVFAILGDHPEMFERLDAGFYALRKGVA